MNKKITGVGITGLIGIAFIVLKLCDVIEWSWLWVLSPFWICFAIAIIVVAILFIFMHKKGE